MFEQSDAEPKVVESQSFPVSSKEQLGQDILRVFAKMSEPERIILKKIVKKVPILEKKTVFDENGEKKEVEVIKGWKEVVFEIPIKQQSKYHELLTDDIARAFLDRDDYYLYLDNGNYCQTIKSFADRYDLDLSTHHNHICDSTNQMVVGSGAIDGQRVILAKADIAKTISATGTFKDLDVSGKKPKGFFDEILGANI